MSSDSSSDSEDYSSDSSESSKSGTDEYVSKGKEEENESRTRTPVKFPTGLNEILKSHQKEGVQFMWDSIVDPVNPLERGCIIAHAMGLGKTLSTCTFIILYFEHLMKKYSVDEYKEKYGVHPATALIVTPKSTLENWAKEIRMWEQKATDLKPLSHNSSNKKDSDEESDSEEDLSDNSYEAETDNDEEASEKIPIYIPSHVSSFKQRKRMLTDWTQDGGVLLLSYPMYTRFVGEMDSKNNNSKHIAFFQKSLNGENCPQLLIADEGHLIKNPKNTSTRALQRVKTTNRILLTGTPVQNRFSELFCMLDFVRPNIWKKDQFKQLFEEPFKKGSNKDSEAQQVIKMKKANYHLQQTLLNTIVHRKGPDVLYADLPKKHEFIFKIKLTPYQKEMYKKVIDAKRDKDDPEKFNDYLFSLVDILRKICNHTDLIRDSNMRSELNDEEEELTTVKHNNNLVKIDQILAPYINDPNYESGIIGDHSSKMQLLVIWIQLCLVLNEKMLIFSQWTSTLDIIESILEKHDFMYQNQPLKFQRNFTYLRLDGSTRKRQTLVDQFNDSNSEAMLFLISTNAGGLGLNLTAASRVMLYDVSWNPANDYQACCRAYRYGQTRDVYIYRMVQAGTVEEAIWNRSCQKTWLSRVVVDKKAAKRRLNEEDLVLFDIEDNNVQETWHRVCMQDRVVQALAVNKSQMGLVSVMEHDSLFDEDYRDKMTESEIAESVLELRNHKWFQEISAEEGWSEGGNTVPGKGGRKRKVVDYSKIGEKPLSASKEIGIPTDLLSRLPMNMASGLQGIKVLTSPTTKRSKLEAVKKDTKPAVQEPIVYSNQQEFLAQRRQAMESLQKKKEEEMAAQRIKKEMRSREVDRIASLMQTTKTLPNFRIPPQVTPKPAETKEAKKPKPSFNIEDTLNLMKRKF